MFLRTVMVVDGVENAVTGERRRPQQHRGLAAVRPDLHADTVIEVAQRGVMQRPAFVGGHESGDPFRQLE
jgi:hypothetical protein